MDPIHLPRPLKGKLPLREVIALERLATLDQTDDGICDHKPEVVASALGLSNEETDALLSSLFARRYILLGSSHFAICSRLSKRLKQERDRNRLRKGTRTPPDWTCHRRTVKAFPGLRTKFRVASSYNRPAAFEPLFKEVEHFHKRQCPADVEILTEACYPGELSTVLTFIEEQRSANRHPVLLFTRKAVYVGVRRAAKR